MQRPAMTRTTRPLGLLVAVFGLAALGLAGCRGTTSANTPIHPNLNMDYTQRFEEQEPNPFFADDAAMRQPVAGTVARGRLRTLATAPFQLGRTASGAFVPTVPVPVTMALLERGQERFGIYCSPCHGNAGDGKGIVMVGNGGTGYGYVPAPSYHTDMLRDVPDGYIYEVITNGVRNMPSYAHVMPPADRWAVVSYIRALQRSQNASAADVPEPERLRLATENPNVNVAR